MKNIDFKEPSGRVQLGSTCNQLKKRKNNYEYINYEPISE